MWEKDWFPIDLDTVAASTNQHPQIPFPKGWNHGHPHARCLQASLMDVPITCVLLINLDVSSCDQIPRDSEPNSPVKAWLHPHTDKGVFVSSTLPVSFVPLAKVFITSFQVVITIRQHWASTARETCPKSVVNTCGQRPLGLRVSLMSTEASSKR